MITKVKNIMPENNCSEVIKVGCDYEIILNLPYFMLRDNHTTKLV